MRGISLRQIALESVLSKAVWQSAPTLTTKTVTECHLCLPPGGPCVDSMKGAGGPGSLSAPAGGQLRALRGQLLCPAGHAPHRMRHRSWPTRIQAYKVGAATYAGKAALNACRYVVLLPWRTADSRLPLDATLPCKDAAPNPARRKFVQYSNTAVARQRKCIV